MVRDAGRSPADDRFMGLALDLAEQSQALASPNPAVGCVLTAGETLLGQGAHHFDARDHAEIAALKVAAQAGRDVRGATAFVTLEPCSHQGRTGPCADALIAAGVARCVVATVDPNPAVRGSGLAKLRAAGVQVKLYAPNSPLTQRARRLNDAFAFAIQHGRPFVTLKSAVSLDGKLAPPPGERHRGRPFWLTGEAARAEVQRLRHAADAVLTGIGTVLADNPLLTDRTGEPRRRRLLRVVLDASLRLPPSSALVQGAVDDLLIVSDRHADAERHRALAAFPLGIAQLPSMHAPDALLHILALLQARQIRSVMVEAGPTLHRSLLEADLVDGVVLFYANVELGPEALPFSANGITPYLLQQRLADPKRRTFPHGPADDVCISGYLHDPWAGF